MKRIKLLCLLLLMVLGILVFTGCKFNFSSLENVTKAIELNQPFDSIRIDADIDDIEFVYVSGEEKILVSESEKRYHEIEVIDNTLSIKQIDDRWWLERLLSWGRQTLVIYLNKVELSNLMITSSTGDVLIPNEFSFNSLNINLSTGNVKVEATTESEINIVTSTGDVTLSGLSARNINITSSTGDTFLKNIVVSETLEIHKSTGRVMIENSDANKITIKTSTGNVAIEDSDATLISIKTTTGDVVAEFRTPKFINANSNTGKVRVQSSREGGSCEIETNTGDITVTISD